MNGLWVGTACFGALLYTRTTLLVSRMALPAVARTLLCFVLSHQAGRFLNGVVSFLAYDGKALFDIRTFDVLPVLGWFSPRLFLHPLAYHSGYRAILDSQVGFLAEAALYILLGAHNFGWTSVAGWPLAVAGLLASVLLRPWLNQFHGRPVLLG